MQPKSHDKKKFVTIVVLLALLVVTIITWSATDYFRTKSTGSIGALIIALILIIFGAKLIKSKYQSLKRGEPLKDERSRRLENKAGAYAFYIGIYWLLALGFAIDEFNLNIPASSATGLGIAGMAIIFGLSYWYFSRKGESI